MRIQLSRGVASLALAVAGVVAVDGRVADAAPLFAVDVNDRSPDTTGDPDSGTQPGFLPYYLGPLGVESTFSNTAGVTQAVGDYSVTFAPAAGYADSSGGTGYLRDLDRDFSLPPGSTMTYHEVYDDFVFQNFVSGGIRLTVSGGQLAPNTQYSISLYSYDHGSTGLRTADYVDLNNNNAYVLTTSFAGGTVPFTNESNKYTGFAMTDASGVISLRGYSTSASPANFISGFEINAVPEPTAALGLIGLGGLLMARRRGR